MMFSEEFRSFFYYGKRSSLLLKDSNAIRDYKADRDHVVSIRVHSHEGKSISVT